MLSTASTRGSALKATLSNLRIEVSNQVRSVGTGPLIQEIASAPRLAWWPLVSLTYSSPISRLKLIGRPSAPEATAMTKPIVSGSTSEAKRLIVWLLVRQMKLSATEQVRPSMKNRWTNTPLVSSVLVMLMRVFSAAGLVELEE